MNEISPCREEDIPAVADLHRRAFHGVNRPASKALINYYRETFFGNPWRRDDMPSLVCRSGRAGVIGFVGVIPRPMWMGDRPITMAIGHRLMVDPQCGDPLLGARLVRSLLQGPQDLFFSDGATDAGRKAIKAAGATVLPLYSMEWVKPLRLSSYAMTAARHKPLLATVAAAAAPVSRSIDHFLPRLSSQTPPWEPPAGATEPLDPGTLLESVTAYSRNRSLRPQYDLASLGWLLGRLHADRERGTLEGFVMRDRAGKPLASCLYFARPRVSGEVLQIAGAPRALPEVMRWLIYRGWRAGFTHLFGRFDPRLLEPLLDLNGLLKRGCWSLAMAKDPAILDAIARGDVFLSNLETELWLSSAHGLDSDD